MKLYLTRHKYANTFTEDLWAALSEASGKPIASIMSGWTKQMGYPVIHVTARQEGEEKRVLHLKQQRFLADGTKDETNSKWMVKYCALWGYGALVIVFSCSRFRLRSLRPGTRLKSAIPSC